MQANSQRARRDRAEEQDNCSSGQVQVNGQSKVRNFHLNGRMISKWLNCSRCCAISSNLLANAAQALPAVTTSVSSAITSGESGVEAAAQGEEIGDCLNIASNNLSPSIAIVRRSFRSFKPSSKASASRFTTKPSIAINVR